MNASAPPEQTVIALVGIGCVFGLPFIGMIVWVVCHYCFKTFKQWQAAALVRDMVNRGYTAQEIIQVCSALGQKKVPPFKPISDVPPAKPIKQPAYAHPVS